MSEALSQDPEFQKGKDAGARLIGWVLFPVALFPLVALMSYDWRAIEALHLPCVPSSNWVGALGDVFAYHGYQFFGFAIWTVPAACLLWGVRVVAGWSARPLKSKAWFALFIVAAACLMQNSQSHAPGLAALMERVNIQNAGGVTGYLVMTRFLSPLLSDFGSSVIAVVALFASLVGIIGVREIGVFFACLANWALTGKFTREARKGAKEADEEDAADPMQDALDAAMEAKEAAKRERLSDKERIKAEKERIKAERERERAEEQARIRAEKDAARTAAAQQKAAQTVRAADKAEAGSAPEEEAKPSKGPYVLPPVTLLNPIPASAADHGNVAETGKRLTDTLKLFNIESTLADTVTGPVVTKYELELAPGTRYSAVTSLSDNIMGAMHAKSLRIEAPVPGKDRVGIEVPNVKPAGISFREIFESAVWRKSKAELPLLFGKDAAGRELVADLATMPHMLVAGATGQGKSVCLNSLINGLLMTRTPEQLKLIMVDPKSVEFTPYASIPHLLVPVITDNRKVVFALHWAVAEMEKRLKLFARCKVRNIFDFNHRKVFSQPDMFGGGETTVDAPRTIPYIVIIIDEVADLMSTSAKEVTPDISRLTAKARAAGIHLILATQRPDAKVITGTIKANIPGRVAFKTAQALDSRTILDDSGAENLIGRGDMLFKSKDGILIRAQGAWISDEEIARITGFIEEHADVQFDEKFATKLGRVKEAAIEDPFASNEDDPDNQSGDESSTSSPEGTRTQMRAAENDDLYKRAIEVIINTKRASVSHFQRKLGIGYNHAAKICDKLEENGVIAPQSGAGPRTILLDQNQLVAIMNGAEVPTGEQGAAGADAPAADAPDSVQGDNTNEPLNDEELPL